ncbi:MAG: GlsB/YeaQ/YmgE family stress response membrane protein [Fenollaria timonensis]
MLYSIIVGALSGWIASLIMKVDKQMGWIKNILAGIIGGGIGKWIAKLAGFEANGGMINDIIVGIVGAVVLIWLVNMIFGRKR